MATANGANVTSNGTSDDKKFAYTTLITRASYLAGVLVLAYTLKKQGSKYPLIVFYTTNLKPSAIKVLEAEAPKLNLILQPCELLLPKSDVKVTLIAERFGDTWTKLRVFSEPVFEYDAVCYLDADMAIFNHSMDEVFSHATDLPKDWIAANHACVCNLDSDPWAPSDWNVENCAYTPLSHPMALTQPTQPTPESRGTYHLLNSGMFLYHPSKDLWSKMLDFFNTTDKLSTYKFPDQDFLADFFHHKWRGIGWQYNALKTMRYIHPNMWRDDAVICLHYIVDKPWASRISPDGTAGFKRKDGETHKWWWDEYNSYAKERRAGGKDGKEVIDTIESEGWVVAEGGAQSDDPDMQAIGNRVQAFANNKAQDENKKPAADGDANGKAQEDSPMKKEGGETRQAFKHKALGERGHGPVVHPKSGSKMVP